MKKKSPMPQWSTPSALLFAGLKIQGAYMSDEMRRNGAESCWEAFRW